MDITTLTDGARLFLDELAELYMPGSVASPKYLKVGYSTDSQNYITLVEDYLYGGFDGRISLDFRQEIQRQISGESTPFSPKSRNPAVQWTHDSTLNTVVHQCSSDIKGKITDIDYLAVSEDTDYGLSYYRPEGYGYEIGILAGGRLIGLTAGDSAAEDGVLESVFFHPDDLPSLLHDRPFRFIVRLVSQESGKQELVYKSPVYEIGQGDFQQFAFADRFGGYTFFPLSGALEHSSEYAFESARYQSGRGKVSASGSPVFTQYTGGLTGKAVAALSGLLLADNIFHKAGGVWHRIVIEDADISFLTGDSLHFGSFSFRYEEDLVLSDVL